MISLDHDVAMLHGDVAHALPLIPTDSCDAVIPRSDRKPRQRETPDTVAAWLVEEDHGFGTPCGVWPWSRAPVGWGYGQVRIDGKTRKTHTVMWEREHGPVPPGLELDHLCRVFPCSIPSHMEPVTHRENVLRGTGPTALNARKSHCDAGHPLVGDLVVIRQRPGVTERLCVLCNRRRAAEARA